MHFEYEYLKSAFSVDNVIFGFDTSSATLKVLQIKRGVEPFVGAWALPGALVKPDEALDEAPIRILKELTDLNDVYLEQVSAFGKVDRHPLGRVITVAYYSLVILHKVSPKASSFATEVAWTPITQALGMPFDHDDILSACLARLQRRLRSQPIGFELLDSPFTLTDLQNLYEAVLHKKLDKRNFRKKLLSMKILEDVEAFQEGVAHRPAKLYKFERSNYEHLLTKGFIFDL